MSPIATSALIAYGLTGAWLILLYIVATYALGYAPIRSGINWLHRSAVCWHRKRMARKRYEAELRHIRHLRNNILS